ncbi:uncharacterized protein LOC132867709 isoform X2 [Neoarius graeffei]|uniref:uncharacterized protein LOC132867709 isoform X2 n=1 Tax=Neoarius graeffei TaxID=443677 RepID=UPI00298D2CBB|nr:uncharacterized protein LOC132867709 isoform X2 [Neoarius graeffei]
MCVLNVLTAHGKKLFFRLFALLFMLLYLVPEGSRLSRWCPGWRWSRMIFLVLERHQELAISSREGRGQPIVFSADLITLCSFFLSAAVQPAYHTVMEKASTLLMVERYVTNGLSSSLFLLRTLRKWIRCWAFLTMAVVLADQARFSTRRCPQFKGMEHKRRERAEKRGSLLTTTHVCVLRTATVVPKPGSTEGNHPMESSHSKRSSLPLLPPNRTSIKR